MTLVTLVDAELAYGLHPLLDGAGFSLEAGERFGLIGRNGTGKSSLLRVIAGEETLSDGELRRQAGLRIAVVEQEPGLPPAAGPREAPCRRGRVETLADERERWRFEARPDAYLQRFGLDAAQDPARASAGERKRAALALAFALDADAIRADTARCAELES